MSRRAAARALGAVLVSVLAAAACAPGRPPDRLGSPAPARAAHDPAPALAPDFELVPALAGAASGLRPPVLQLALRARACAARRGLVARPTLLGVIDYSLPSVAPRLWVLDLATRRVLFEELVAHGRETGDDLALHFSNVPGSRRSSLGLFVTEEAYVGRNGYSLRLRGLEDGVNHRARERAIVMHGAPYVSAATCASFGRLGRSWGCPAVAPEVAAAVIDTLKDGAPLFVYYPDGRWLAASSFLGPCDEGARPGGRAAALR